MRVLKIDRTIIEIGFENNWNRLMDSYNAKGFDKLEIIGNLNLSGLIINDLPKKMNVYGNLELRECEINCKLPEVLYVDGYLSFNRTKINYLPKNLYVGEWLDIEYSNITKIPESAVIKKTIFYPRQMMYSDE